MIEEIEIKLWGKIAGYAAYRNSRLIYFEYADELNKNYELSPILMPRSQKKVWSFDLNDETYHGLPGLLADSLPDKYGWQMIDAYFLNQGIDLAKLNSLDRLCYLGTRAMGALEFYPNKETESNNKAIEIEKLLDISAKILKEREDLFRNRRFRVTRSYKNPKIENFGGVLSDPFMGSERTPVKIEADEEDLGRVIQMGSSAGGARAKAVIAINHKTGEIRSGQVQQPGFQSSIIKLDALTNESLKDPLGYTNIEYAYYLMAVDAGIKISPSRLIEKNGLFHFISKRFDREDDGSKIHMQSLCALAHLDFNYPRVHSYQTLFRVANRLELPMEDKEQIFKVMAFNVIGRNHDDHTKNFSFLMDRDGKWRLAPAYDLTYSNKPDNKWLREHNLLINGKSTEITRDDLMVYAKTFHIKKAGEFIEGILEVFSRWKSYAKEAKVCKERAKEIERNFNLLFS